MSNRNAIDDMANRIGALLMMAFVLCMFGLWKLGELGYQLGIYFWGNIWN